MWQDWLHKTCLSVRKQNAEQTCQYVLIRAIHSNELFKKNYLGSARSFIHSFNAHAARSLILDSFCLWRKYHSLKLAVHNDNSIETSMEWDGSTRRDKWVDVMMDIETIKRGNEKFLQSYHSKYKLPLWEIIFYCPFLRTKRTWEINSQNNSTFSNIVRPRTNERPYEFILEFINFTFEEMIIMSLIIGNTLYVREKWYRWSSGTPHDQFQHERQLDNGSRGFLFAKSCSTLLLY